MPIKYVSRIYFSKLAIPYFLNRPGKKSKSIKLFIFSTVNSH